MHMTTYEREVTDLISEITITALSNGIGIYLSSDKSLTYADEDIRVSGYFSAGDTETPPVLAVATGKPLMDWVAILLHEGCHMEQYIEDCEAWRNITMPNGKEATDVMFEWIEHKIELTPEELDDVVARALGVELDCERRTHSKIKRCYLDHIINPNEYVKKANAYIYFYLYSKSVRKFYTGGFEPYNVYDVWSVAPDNFDGDYTQIPPALHKAFTEHLGIV